MACQVFRNKESGEIERVVNSRGKESKLFQALLKEFGNDRELALDAWAISQTESFLKENPLGRKHEATLESVMDYYEKISSVGAANFREPNLDDTIKDISGIDSRDIREQLVNDKANYIANKMLDNHSRTGKYEYKIPWSKDKIVLEGKENIKANNAKIRAFAESAVDRDRRFNKELSNSLEEFSEQATPGEKVTELPLNWSEPIKKVVGELNANNKILHLRNGERIISYKSLKDHPKFKDLHSKFFDETDFNPIVKVYEDSVGNMHVSIFDVASERFDKNLRFDKSGAFSLAHDNPAEFARQKLSLLANEEGLRKTKLLFAAMAMKKTNPKVLFDRIVLTNTRRGGQQMSMYIPHYLSEMKKIVQVPEVMAGMGETMKKFFEDETLYDPQHYKQDYIGALVDNYRALIDKIESSAAAFTNMTPEQTKFVERLNNTIDRLNENYKEDTIFSREVETIYKDRMSQIIKKHNGDKESIRNHEDDGPEFKLLSEALEELGRRGSVRLNAKFVDLTWLQRMMKGNYNMTNPVIRWIVATTKSRLDKVGTRYQKEVLERLAKPLDLLKKVHGANLAGGLVDKGWKYYDSLFIKKTMRDKEGKEANVETGEIHFRIKQADGSYKYSDNLPVMDRPSDAALDVGGHIVQMVRDYFIELKEAQGYKRKDAEEWYEENWKDGMIPVMKKRASEKVGELKITEAAKQAFERYSNSDEHFNDLASKSEYDQPHEIASRFIGQAEGGAFGGKNRASMLGFELDSNGEHILGDKAKNVDFEKNLEVVMAYLAMNTITKVEMEKIMPEFYAAQSIMYNYEKHGDADMRQTQLWLQDFMDFMVKGKRKGLFGGFTGSKNESGALKMVGKNKVHTISADNFVHSAGAMATYGMIAGNIFIDATNLLTNIFGSVSFSVASHLANTGFFGIKEWTKASGHYIKNRKLVDEIMKEYRVADMDLNDMVNVSRFFKTKNHFNTHHLYYLNFIGDQATRGIAFVSQMIKDGTFDAHSLDKDGKLVYDEAKDERAKDTETWSLIRQEVGRKLEDEGVPLKKDGKLARAYDSRRKNSIKNITDKFIMGGYDRESQRTLEMYLLGKQFSQFKRYLFDKWENTMTAPGEIDMGNYEVKTKVDSKGNEVKYVDWKGLMYEGMGYSVANLIRDAQRGGLSGLKESWQSSEIRRFNMIKLGTDVTMVLTMMAVAGAIFDDDDDSQRAKQWAAFTTTRTWRSVQYSFADLVAQYNPGESLRALSSPFVSARNLKNYGDLAAAAFSANTKDMDKAMEKTFGIIKTVNISRGKY